MKRYIYILCIHIHNMYTEPHIHIHGSWRCSSMAQFMARGSHCLQPTVLAALQDHGRARHGIGTLGLRSGAQMEKGDDWRRGEQENDDSAI